MSEIKVSSYGAGQVTLSGLTSGEVDRVIAAAHGASWIRIKGGALQTVSSFEALPDPIKDEKMLPFWKEERAHPAQHELLDIVFEELQGNALYFPDIMITGLCGYHYTPESYQREAEKLLSYGFTQLRSPRGEDGQYWEVWRLPGVWFAKGDLAEAIRSDPSQKQSKVTPTSHHEFKEDFQVAVEFLRRHVQFGSLSVSVQRCAMVIDGE